MKNATGFGKLVKDLSRDPRLKKAVAKAGRRPRGTGVRKVEDTAGLFALTMKIASHFVKKKKARALQEAMDVIYLLVRVSILLKENIFDRPEVKKFFHDSFRQIYAIAQAFVAMVLPRAKVKAISAQAEGPLCAQAKGARPTRAVRSV